VGLLDSIVGGIARSALGGGIGTSGLRGLGGGAGRSNILMALLPVVIGMLANRTGGTSSAGGGIDRALGSLGGTGALAGLGGLGGLLQRFQQKGYADQVQSWVGTGQNQPIAPDALSQVFEQDQLSQIASQAGVSEDEARTGLAELLPQVVDHLTPGGQLPDAQQLHSSVDELQRELQQRA
jgi:uncharacterized protein YidB (DUF937 family)